MATLRQYTDIFNACFNLSFLNRKKTYSRYVNNLSSPEEKVLMKTSNEEHLKNKSIVRDKKILIKRERLINQSFVYLAVFDLQKVLITPKSEVSSFYYKQNLRPIISPFMILVKKLAIVIHGTSVRQKMVLAKSPHVCLNL